MLTITEEAERELIAALDQIATDFKDAHDPGENQARQLPEGTRQILYVSSYKAYSASDQLSTANPVLRSQAYLILEGSPTPSSSVTSAVLRFVEAPIRRRPSYSVANKRIDMQLDIGALPLVLEQLKHRTRYVWIGHFQGGHFYADLHTTP